MYIVVFTSSLFVIVESHRWESSCEVIVGNCQSLSWTVIITHLATHLAHHWLSDVLSFILQYNYKTTMSVYGDLVVVKLRRKQ